MGGGGGGGGGGGVLRPTEVSSVVSTVFTEIMEDGPKKSSDRLTDQKPAVEFFHRTDCLFSVYPVENRPTKTVTWSVLYR